MEIRGFQEGDEDGIRELFEVCFGRVLTHAEWLWKYNSSPYGSASTVAVDDGKIIAHYGGIRLRFYFRGKNFDVFQPCDIMTHPRFRGRIFSRKGVLVKTAEHFYNTNLMDFAFGFPSERHAILGIKQLGYTWYKNVTVLSKKTVDRHLCNPFLKTETDWDSVHGEEIDLLWEEIKDDFGLSIEKNHRYIFWRYRDTPSRVYIPFIVRDRLNMKLKAFSTLSIKGDELCILDLFIKKNLDIDTIMKYIERFAKRSGVKKITLWANPLDPISCHLVDYGFVQGKGIPYVFKILKDVVDVQFLFENYHYRMGDYDAS